MLCGVLNSPGLSPRVAPRLHPVAVLVDLGDARVDVAVADEDVAGRIPGDVGHLAEAPVLGRQRRLGMLERRGVFVRRLLLAAEHHQDLAFGAELDDQVGALVGAPDVVVAVDAHGVRERPGVEVLADLANEVAVGVELEQLRRGRGVRRAGRVAAREHEHVALGVDRDAGRLAEVEVLRQLERVGNRIEGDLRHGNLCAGGCRDEEQERDEQLFHWRTPVGNTSVQG